MSVWHVCLGVSCVLVCMRHWLWLRLQTHEPLQASVGPIRVISWDVVVARLPGSVLCVAFYGGQIALSPGILSRCSDPEVSSVRRLSTAVASALGDTLSETLAVAQVARACSTRVQAI
jgi:hypothetical protein